MYVVEEKTFLYSIALCINVPTKREIVQALKKNNLRYNIKDINSLMVDIRANSKKHACTFILEDPGIAVIVFYKWESDAFDYGTLTHELFHSVDLFLRHHRGIRLSDDSDEVYAYHLGYFTRNFLNFIWEKKK
jgi:hypothetical protein